MEDIFKKPEPSSAESYYILLASGKSHDEIKEYVESLNTKDEAALDILKVIFKKCEYRDIRIQVGKII